MVVGSLKNIVLSYIAENLGSVCSIKPCDDGGSLKVSYCRKKFDDPVLNTPHDCSTCLEFPKSNGFGKDEDLIIPSCYFNVPNNGRIYDKSETTTVPGIYNGYGPDLYQNVLDFSFG